MKNTSNLDQHMGWEHIWTSGDIPPRFSSFSEPNASVVEWVDTLQPKAFVLDVGCGAGRHCIYLGKLGFRVAGQDISPAGLALAQKACDERQIVFDGRISDMTNLPWGDMTFDAALSTSTIHHHLRANIARSLADVRRVLKSGGVFLVDFPCTDTFIYQQLRDMVAAGQIVEVEPNTFVDERPDTDDPDGFLPHHFSDEADLRDLLRSFEIIRLWADLKDITLENGKSAKSGKWIAWLRKS
jgi:SAM-dependent methyltransferase